LVPLCPSFSMVPGAGVDIIGGTSFVTPFGRLSLEFTVPRRRPFLYFGGEYGEETSGDPRVERRSPHRRRVKAKATEGRVKAKITKAYGPRQRRAA
jgi:hypothetical protein